MPEKPQHHARDTVVLASLLAGCEAQVPAAAGGSCSAMALEVGSVDAGEGGGVATATPVDVASLLEEMLTLTGLARRPLSPYRTCMASSYDRQSKVPQIASDTPEGWFANHDWDNYAGSRTGARGRRERVLLNTDGPGAIVRIWSATPSGTVRIYLDKGTDAVLEAPTADLLAGRVVPFLSPFGAVTARGGNFEFPVPFRTHAMVTWEGDGGFYQVTYRRYDSTSADVKSMDLSMLQPSVVESARARLASEATTSFKSGDAIIEETLITSSSPEFAVTASSPGGEILSIEVRPNLADADTLRSTILRIRFDDAETVVAPLGDFFGAGPGLLPHATLPLAVTADGTLISRFVMPFRREAVVRLDGRPEFRADVKVRHRVAPFDRRTYYFHAQWTARGPMPARPFRDVLVADIAGEGAYVGTLLEVGNSANEWWGEGEEKIWLDDDEFPSLFGTGTEDYFGQAHCSPEIYSHPYRAQTLAAGQFGAARGLFSLFRAHVLDAIRFSDRMRFYLELWHWSATASVTFDTVTYFYLSPDGVVDTPQPAQGDFRLSPLVP